jgi:hypothetical protein
MKKSFPLSAISLAMFAGYTELVHGAIIPWYETISFQVGMKMGNAWQITRGDLFIIGALFGLFTEIFKASRTGRTALRDHAQSFAVFAASLWLFLVRPGYGNSLFFMFLATTVFDVLTGFVITASSGSREVSLVSADDEQQAERA